MMPPRAVLTIRRPGFARDKAVRVHAGQQTIVPAVRLQCRAHQKAVYAGNDHARVPPLRKHTSRLQQCDCSSDTPLLDHPRVRMKT